MNVKKFVFISLSLAALLFTAFLPRLLSTSPGNKILVHLAQKRGYSFHAAQLSWFGPQKIFGLHFLSDSLDFSSKIFETDMDLKSLINLTKPDNKAIDKLSSTISLEEASIKITLSEMPLISLTGINGRIITHSINRHLNILLSGKSMIDGCSGNFDLSSIIGTEVKEGKLTLNNFPILSCSSFFEKSVANESLISSLFGPSINLTSTFKVINSEGPISFTLSSPLLKTEASANYSNGTVTLSGPLDASILLTEEIAPFLMKDFNPQLIYGLKALNPIKIKIPPGCLYLPLHPLNIKELTVENAMIDFGEILTKNGKIISSLLSLLKHPELSEEMQVKSAPTFIKISKGKIFISRADALIADKIHICAWGSIDLLTKKMKMILGLTAHTLKKGFRIKGLPADYVLKIPLKGTVDDPKIDTGQALTKISALLAMQSAKKKIALEELCRSFEYAEDQSDVPPPNLPYPWEK